MTETAGNFTANDEELDLVEEEQDPYTIAKIEQFGLPAGASCLDLGGGRGSITRHLLAMGAAVTAVDRDTTQMRDLHDDRLTLIESKLEDLDLQPASYDLVHARALLTHVPEREHLLQRMVSWLKPGGWLLVTDPADFPVASSPYPIVRRFGNVLSELSTMLGTDTSWARRYPAQLIEHGLVDVDAESRLRMMQGGTCEAKMLSGLYGRARPMLLKSGCTDEEVDEILTLLDDPNYIDLPPAVIRAWGRMPTTGAEQDRSKLTDTPVG